MEVWYQPFMRVWVRQQAVEHEGMFLGRVIVPPEVTQDLAVVQLDGDPPGEVRLVPLSRVRPV